MRQISMKYSAMIYSSALLAARFKKFLSLAIAPLHSLAAVQSPYISGLNAELKERTALIVALL